MIILFASLLSFIEPSSMKYTFYVPFLYVYQEGKLDGERKPETIGKRKIILDGGIRVRTLYAWNNPNIPSFVNHCVLMKIDEKIFSADFRMTILSKLIPLLS